LFMKSLNKGILEGILICLVLLVFGPLVYSQQEDSLTTENLFELSLDDLMNIEIESAVKQKQNITEAPSVITVITSKQIKGWKIRFEFNSTHFEDYPIPLITSLSSRKVAFKIPQIPAEFIVGSATSGRLLIVDDKGKIQGNPEGLNLTFTIKTAGEKHKVTFISSIDGSVQYYAVVPPVDGFKEGQALFVSLHGASVEAQGQANAYAAKDWGTIVAPTNRRPYGFDWEDWGRADAMEVLNISLDTYKPDPQRLYLTGHSMGGHGTWHIGLTFPGIWAAIAPSAGWVSFWSYAGKQLQSQPDPLREVFNRASASSNTLSLMNNTRQFGVYVLHGDKDDNVPVEQARIMRDTLGKFHPDFCYYEEPGAGHWWGNQCVDWPPLFDFFKHHKRKTALETSAFSFTTASPGISSQSGWVSVWQQSEPGIPSSVDVFQDTTKGQVRLQTRNVQMLRLDLDHIPVYQSWNLTIDGVEMPIKAGERGDLYLKKTDQGWKAGQPDFNQKNPLRYGGFKDVFHHKVVLVFGTSGNNREDELNFMKARFDAETFWYRANGSLEIISDLEFDTLNYPESNIILYGNIDTNSWYGKLLGHCPVVVSRNKVSVGDSVFEGEDLAIYFIYPAAGVAKKSIGVISGTSEPGSLAAMQNRYFVSGSGFPDLFLFKLSMLDKGESGVELSGYFGNDWSIGHGFWSKALK